MAVNVSDAIDSQKKAEAATPQCVAAFRFPGMLSRAAFSSLSQQGSHVTDLVFRKVSCSLT
jgi:hypothetical protein